MSMTMATTLANLQSDSRMAAAPNMAVSLDTVGGFESMQRVAKLFASSSIVPKSYQGRLADCFIAVDMAMRMGANPLMVMQNLYLVHGNPAWSAQFLIATFNKSGRFSALRYEFQGNPGENSWGCRAVAIELATKEKLEGPLITIEMAKKEGWYGKPGSKWQTMPEQMLRYRAAAWFIRAYAPEIAMGIHTVEEARDAEITLLPGADGSYGVTMEELEQQAAKTDGANTVSPEAAETGQISESAEEKVEVKVEESPGDGINNAQNNAKTNGKDNKANTQDKNDSETAKNQETEDAPPKSKRNGQRKPEPEKTQNQAGLQTNRPPDDYKPWWETEGPEADEW